jgi:hypothetical protein
MHNIDLFITNRVDGHIIILYSNTQQDGNNKDALYAPSSRVSTLKHCYILITVGSCFHGQFAFSITETALLNALVGRHAASKLN